MRWLVRSIPRLVLRTRTRGLESSILPRAPQMIGCGAPSPTSRSHSRRSSATTTTTALSCPPSTSTTPGRTCTRFSPCLPTMCVRPSCPRKQKLTTLRSQCAIRAVSLAVPALATPARCLTTASAALVLRRMITPFLVRACAADFSSEGAAQRRDANVCRRNVLL
eukprot:Rmarinus@m.14650